MFLTFKLIYDDMKVFKLQQTADAASSKHNNIVP